MMTFFVADMDRWGTWRDAVEAGENVGYYKVQAHTACLAAGEEAGHNFFDDETWECSSRVAVSTALVGAPLQMFRVDRTVTISHDATPIGDERDPTP